MRVRGESETIDVLLHHVFRFFDALRDFNFLLPGQKRHLTHLFKVHPDWIIQDVELRLRFLFLFFVRILFDFLLPIDIGRFDHVNFQFS